MKTPTLVTIGTAATISAGMFALGRHSVTRAPGVTNEVVRYETREAPYAYYRSHAPPVTNEQGLVSLRVTDAYLIDGGEGWSLNLMGKTQSHEIFMTPNGPLMYQRLLIWAYPVGLVEFRLEPLVVRRTLWPTNAQGQLIWRTNHWGDPEPAVGLASNWWGNMPMSRRISLWDAWMLGSNDIHRGLLAPYATNFYSTPITPLQ